MRSIRYTISIILLFIFCQFTIPSFGQLGISFDIKKPKEYDERVLRSEKSDQKKFSLYRRMVQNAVTHYNYYFNANNKLNEVLERAKISFTDDYSQLLPFYNYSLDATQQDSILLDSITYKSSTGIALHDLRNDWADNLYLLWGAAYYLEKKFDSAFLMFQFINYAFAEKEKDGYYKTIGSNRDGNSALSIATKEKTSLTKKIFSEPPSRNDAFIWQIRNFLAQDQFSEAASLIITLKNDLNFPKRLQNDLAEVQAYWFYKQNMWDSAATYLTEALDNATTKQEKTRWEYLAAQLYEMTGKYIEAEKYYTKVISHTTDPIMDVYARLFSVRVNKDGTESSIDKNIAELLKMAKRDRYQEYRDIIYYMAAQMELERNNTDGALALLLKSTQYSGFNNMSQRNKAFLQLAELTFVKKQYRQSHNFYDSISFADPALKDVNTIIEKKEMLDILAANMEIVTRQDSLQHIAQLPEDERKDLVKKMVRQLRKLQGLKDENLITTTSPFTITTAPTLFPSVQSKGEWYFYNAASRTRGKAEFAARWGNRPNVDNWRRLASVSATLPNNRLAQNQSGNNGSLTDNQDNASKEITYENLYANIPLTTEQLQLSNDSIQNALFILGKIYVQQIEDCPWGTQTLEELRSRFPQFSKMDEVLFNLYYCYNKNGERDKATIIKKLMSEKNPTSNFTAIVVTGKDPQVSIKSDATATYEKVYDLFIEGNFSEAIAQKKTADSIYGKNYWTPQLLYIESVYYIKQKEDSIAKTILNDIISQFSGSPLAGKATTLLDVLSRRSQIEEELRNMVINRPAEDTVKRTFENNNVVVNKPIVKDTTATKPPVAVTKINTKPLVVDTIAKQPPKITASYSFKGDEAHYVVLILNKVDPVFSNEAKNAFFRYNRETFYNKPMAADLVELDADNRLLLISPFKTAQEAIDYIAKTQPKTASEIIPWLKGGKYSFSIITDNNLQLLKNDKNIETYKSFLNQHLPGKF